MSIKKIYLVRSHLINNYICSWLDCDWIKGFLTNGAGVCVCLDMCVGTESLGREIPKEGERRIQGTKRALRFAGSPPKLIPSSTVCPTGREGSGSDGHASLPRDSWHHNICFTPLQP